MMINFPFQCQGPTTGDLLKVVGVEVKIGDVSEVKRQHMGCLQKPSKVPRSWLILRISTVVDYLLILNNINILLCAWICIKSLMVIFDIPWLTEYRPDFCIHVHTVFSLCICLWPNFPILLGHQSYSIKSLFYSSMTSSSWLITSPVTLFPNEVSV